MLRRLLTVLRTLALLIGRGPAAGAGPAPGCRFEPSQGEEGFWAVVTRAPWWSPGNARRRVFTHRPFAALPPDDTTDLL